VNLLICDHDANPELEAARVLHLVLDRGDREGQLVWLRMLRPIRAVDAPLPGKAN
jgi:hypothetical protein